MTSCELCSGFGFREDDCSSCNGHGVVYTPLEEPCDACNGTGHEPCSACGGRGYFDDPEGDLGGDG